MLSNSRLIDKFLAKGFEEMKKINFCQHLSVSERSRNETMDEDTFKTIHPTHVADIFMNFFRKHQSKFVDEFRSVQCTKLGLDHTFYATSILKIVNLEGSKRQFNALLIVLNEIGTVYILGH